MADIITKLEKETGLVAHQARRMEKITTKDELVQDYADNRDAYLMINYDDRVAFLEANGYKVTRRNLLNADLSSKHPPEDAEQETE